MGVRTPSAEHAAFLLRLLLGSLFIAHLYWKFAVLPGGVATWWSNLANNGYPSFVAAYVLSAEFAGALLLIPGIFARYVALYCVPMMIGAAQFWLARKGFYFTTAGAELPLVWLALLVIQSVAGDGACAVLRSPDWRDLATRLGLREPKPAQDASYPRISRPRWPPKTFACSGRAVEFRARAIIRLAILGIWRVVSVTWLTGA